MSTTAPLSPLRIASWSSALALHGVLVVLLGLVHPASVLSTPPTPPMRVDWVPVVTPPVQPPPPMPVAPIRPVRPPTPTAVARVTVPVVVEEAPWVEPVQAAVDTTTPASTGAWEGPAVDTLPVTSSSSLRYRHAPSPSYPAAARRAQLTGEVLLRVQVGLQGEVLDVQIERSSGHRVLDKHAQAHVKNTWSFEPTLQQGQAVISWGLVPIRFVLDG